MSSFNGIIVEVPGIAVDNFECHNKRAYFLSHCHRDHTQGLANPHLKKYIEDHNVFIYMSEQSAAIIMATTDFVDVQNNVKTLKVGTKTEIKLEATEEHQELYLEVTTLPAGHCFGSVMYLFRTSTKTVLYTGDFRIDINDVSKYSQLHKDSEPIRLDKIYLDTTFLGYDYCDFPKRSDSVEYCVSEVEKWLQTDPDNYIALHTSARIGYEYVYNEIFRRLGVKVYVGDDWEMYRTHQDLVPGVTNDASATRLHKCRNRRENLPHRCLPYDVTGKRFLYIHLSAMKWSNFSDEDRTFTKTSDRRIDVCFPTHCSKRELVHFVSYFAPKSVHGFPNEFKMDAVEDRPDVVFKASRKRKLNGVR